jgi:FkbM family methyltransferase
MKRVIRSVLVRAPFLGEAKSGAKRLALKALRKPFEPEFRVLAALRAAPGEVALDVGANRGQSIDAIRLFQPALPIIAFEPDAALSRRLGERFEGDKSVEVRRYGLGEKDASMTLYTPVYGDYVFDGLASTDRDEAESWLNARTLLGFDPAKLTLREQTIEIRPLDALGLAPAFLKLDVQGAEEAALAGANAAIDLHRPAMLIETGTNEALVARAIGFGYRAYNFANGRLAPRMIQMRNTVFVHPEAPRGLTGLITG